MAAKKKATPKKVNSKATSSKKNKDEDKKKKKKKTLIALLATGGVVIAAGAATAAAIVLTHHKNSSNATNIKIGADDQVSWDAENVTINKKITSQDELDKAYGVFDNNENRVSDVTITTDPKLPLAEGQKVTIKVSYKLPPYDGTKEQKNTINELNDGETKGKEVAHITIDKNGKVSDDYGHVDGKVNMGKPKLSSDGVPDGKGFFKGKTSDGKEVSVNADGYLVDTTSDPSKVGSGFGKRIAGLDKNGKPLTDDAANGDKQNIYLDNDGYRIKYYGSDSTEVKDGVVAEGWHRVSNDGKNILGPDSGSNSWPLSDDQSENWPAGLTKEEAPYVVKDKEGNVTGYLNKDGLPVETSGDNIGKVIPNEPAQPANDKYAGKEGTGSHKEEANSEIKKETTTSWTLSGDAEITLGKNAKAGSIVVGDNGIDGIKSDPRTAVALDPSDPASHQWTTIPSGKYAGMQVKISDDGNKVVFQWPVKNSQINDIISKSGKKQSNDSNSPLDENGKINMPIEYTSGKDGSGEKLGDQKVNITTPWDNNGDESTNSALSWWIDSTMAKSILSYDAEETDVNVYLSSSLVNAIKNNNFLTGGQPKYAMFMPKYDGDYLNVSIDGLTDSTNKENFLDSILKNKDGLNYIQFHVKASAQGLSFAENKDETLNFNDEQEPFIKGAHALKGTEPSALLSLTAISKTITFNNDSYAKTDDNNSVEFSIDKSKLPSAVNFDNDPSIKIKKKDSAEDAVGIKESGLLASTDGLKWDKTNYTIKLNFADGKLDKSQYELTTSFDIKNDRTEDPFGPVENKLIVDKATATTSELAISTSKADVQFNGYTATWKDFTHGALIDDKSNPEITISYAENAHEMRAFTLAGQDYTNLSWDGSTLQFNLSNIPDVNEYTVNAKFHLKNGFGDTELKQTLTVKKDEDKSIDWKEDKDKLSFGNADSRKVSLITTNSKAFDAKTIVADKSSIEFQGDESLKSHIKTSFDTDGNAVFEIVDGDIPFQTNKLSFLVTAVDAKGNELNPTIIQISKDHAMSSQSQINWSNPEAEFDDTNISWTVADKATMQDVDFSKQSFSLVAVPSEQKDGAFEGQSKVIDPADYDYSWDETTLSIKLNKEIDKANYKFTTTFKLGNGYENDPATKTTIVANKDKPLERSVKLTDADIKQTAYSLDNYAEAVWHIEKSADQLPKALNLDDSKAIKVELDNPKFADALDTAVFDKSTMQIKVKLKDKAEIPYGNSDVKISLGFKDWVNPETGKPYGYDGGGSVVAAKGHVTKSIPTDGHFDIKFKNTDVTMKKDVNIAEFDLDEDNSGVDVSTKDLTKIQQSIDGGNTWVDLDKSEITYTYENGKLIFNFTDKLMHTPDLHKVPRKFKVWLGIGNGYENNTDYVEQHKYGFEYKGTPLTVTKSEASSFESDLVIDGADIAQNFNDSNKTTEDGKIKTTWHEGTWNISKLGSDIDINNPVDVKISNIDTPQGPYDPAGMIIDPNDGDPKIDDKSPRKNPAKAGNYALKVDTDGDKQVLKLAIKDGSLWKGTYNVDLTFKLKDYDETVKTTLKFSKTEANTPEKEVETVPGVYFKNYWHHTHSLIDPNGLTHPGKYFIETQITFKKFGGAIDVTNPIINIITDPKKDGKFYYYTTEQDPKTGNITVIFRCWQIFLIDKAGPKHKTDYSKFTIKFGLSTFGGTTDPISFDWADYDEVIEK